jgi:hypothetical protein
MDALVVRPFGKRFVLALLLLAGLAVQFWTQSRYPSLNEKAVMGNAIQLEDSLSFEARIPVLPEYPAWKKIGISTLNWIKTNERGMTFGVLFAAAFLTLLGYLRRVSFRGGFANSFLGMAVGTPLGVCVNCAAPIAKGLYSGGVRAEATLSAMIASPTLNIVVLTMLFSLMPFYMAVAKLAVSLFVILLAVPILCRFLPERQLQLPRSGRPVYVGPELPEPVAAEGPLLAAIRFVRDYAVNLWFIIWTTVPLMLLAGFLGAVVTTFLPAAAQHGDPVAAFMLGYLLSNAPQGERDFRAAARWYRRAAEKGLGAAMTNLGLLYVRGLGVPQDYVLGYMWINLAAAGGLADAVKARDAVSAHMTPAQINEAQQLASRRWKETAEGKE